MVDNSKVVAGRADSSRVVSSNSGLVLLLVLLDQVHGLIRF